MTRATPRPDPAEPVRRRDRDATERAIVAAAIALLTEKGFQGFGLNALAERAGVNKQLVYRYFGGIDGVIDALGERVELWAPGTDAQADARPTTYAELVALLLDAYIAGLRANRLTQRLILWELVESSPALERLEAARSKALQAWMAARRGDLVPPPGVDVAAINALLLAAVNQLALREAAVGSFAGLVLTDEAGWGRIRAAARTVIALAFREQRA